MVKTKIGFEQFLNYFFECIDFKCSANNSVQALPPYRTQAWTFLSQTLKTSSVVGHHRKWHSYRAEPVDRYT